MRKFSVKVLGCQMNVYDGDRLRTAMVQKGWTECSDEDADVVFLVTCSIREKAEQKAASDIGRYNARYEEYGKPVVAFTGCMAQRIGAEMSKRFRCVKLVSGPRHLGLVPEGIESVLSNKKPLFMLDEDPRALDDLEVAPFERSNPFKAYVTITYGCDRFCSYCIVPYVRGRLKSRTPEEIMSEVRELADDGAVEISLLGQNVNSYGKDVDLGITFAGLLAEVSKVKGIKRVRFATSHPRDFDDDILQVMSKTPSLCRAINLPVQSGSDSILKAMNRGYTSGQYRDLVGRIRAALPGVSLTTDLIVGFPGETDDDFRDSYNLLKDIRFDIVHTAAYSPRPGTRAAVMDGQIDRRVKAARLNEVNAMQSAIAREVNESYIGKECEILIDAPAPKGEGLLQGRTMTDKVVIVEGKPNEIGKFKDVRITGAGNWSLEGEILR